MKFLFSFFLVFLLTFQHSQSQVIDTSTDKSPQESYDYFSLKQKRQKIGAWICIGSGIVMTLTGLTINSSDEIVEIYTLGLAEVEDVHKGDWLIYLGSATTIASIPLFVSASKNKRKASMSLKGETVSFGNLTYKNSKHLSIALTIDF